MPSEMLSAAALPVLGEMRPRTITDQIFDLLYERVVNLTLPPGAKLSEAEVAAQMGVSRQPVRDAFYRLSQLGFIQIRPQRATVITQISEQAVLQAYFIRAALEESCMRVAADKLTGKQMDALDELVDRQAEAIDGNRRTEFHALDDQFHHDICHYAGLGFVWALVKENKGHMDRARFLSLSYNGASAVREHRQILLALRRRDSDAAVAAIRHHLGQIEGIIARVRQERPGLFGE